MRCKKENLQVKGKVQNSENLIVNEFNQNDLMADNSLPFDRNASHIFAKYYYPQIKKEEGISNSGFANVKFFNVSSFSNDALEHTDGTNKTSEKNALKYESSPKRMELPLIWMLNQFGILA